jgi:hypothetical protein
MSGDGELRDMTKAIRNSPESEQKRFDRITVGIRDMCCHVFAGVSNGSISLKTSRKVNSLAGKINSLARRYIRSQDV